MSRVLVVFSSKRGGTAGIAEAVGDWMRSQRIDVDVTEAKARTPLTECDALVIGSALYGGRWRRSAVRTLRRASRIDPRPPLWLFHSGPLGDDQSTEAQNLPGKVAELAERAGGQPVVTFGGRLRPDAGGFVAKAMVRNGKGGDWRDFERVRAWADAVADRVVDHA